MANEISNILWTMGRFYPAEIINTFKNHFPVIAKIDEVDTSDDNTQDVKEGTILCFSRIGIQNRAVAYGKHKRSLSIPLDYPYCFEVKTRSGFTDPRTLNDILYSIPLPVTIRFDSRVAGNIYWSSSSGTSMRAEEFGELTIKWVYQEKFLQGAYIENDTNISNNYIVMPCHFNIKMKVGKGMNGQANGSWEKFKAQHELDQSVYSLPALQRGNHVFVFNGLPDNEKQIYANIQSSNYGLLHRHPDSGYSGSLNDNDYLQRFSTGSQGLTRSTPSSHHRGTRERVSGSSHHLEGSGQGKHTHPSHELSVNSDHGRQPNSSHGSGVSPGHGRQPNSSHGSGVSSGHGRQPNSSHGPSVSSGHGMLSHSPLGSSVGSGHGMHSHSPHGSSVSSGHDRQSTSLQGSHVSSDHRIHSQSNQNMGPTSSQNSHLDSSQNSLSDLSQNIYSDSSQGLDVCEETQTDNPTTDDAFCPGFADLYAAATAIEIASHTYENDTIDKDTHAYENAEAWLPSISPPLPQRQNRNISASGSLQIDNDNDDDLTRFVPAPNQILPH